MKSAALLLVTLASNAWACPIGEELSRESSRMGGEVMRLRDAILRNVMDPLAREDQTLRENYLRVSAEQVASRIAENERRVADLRSEACGTLRDDGGVRAASSSQRARCERLLARGEMSGDFTGITSSRIRSYMELARRGRFWRANRANLAAQAGKEAVGDALGHVYTHQSSPAQLSAARSAINRFRSTLTQMAENYSTVAPAVSARARAVLRRLNTLREHVDAALVACRSAEAESVDDSGPPAAENADEMHSN